MTDTTNDRETDKPAKPCLKRCYLFTPAERCDACPANLPQAQSTKPAQQIRDDQAAESSPMTDKDRAKLERLAARLDPLTPIGPQVAPYFPPTDEDQARMDKMIAGALTKPAQESAQPVSNADELPDWVASLGRQVQEMVADDAQGYCRLRLPDAARALHDYGEQKAELDALRAEVQQLMPKVCCDKPDCTDDACVPRLRAEVAALKNDKEYYDKDADAWRRQCAEKDAQLAALRSGDMVMVPREPSEKMVAAFEKAWLYMPRNYVRSGNERIIDGWNAMLAAAEEERK